MALTLKTDFVNDPNLDNALSPTYTVTRASTKTFTDWEGVVRTVPANAYAVEGGRFVRNLALQSETLDNASWTKNNCSVSANAVADPFGGSAADSIVEASDTAKSHWAHQLISFTAGRVYTFSCYVRSGARTDAMLELHTGAFANDVRTKIDIDAGTVAQDGTGVESSGIEDIGDGWYRAWTTATADATVAATARIYAADGLSFTYNGDGTSNIYVYGLQVEDVTGQADQSPSEYQATTTAAAHKWYATKKNGDALDTPITGVSVEESRTNLALYSQDTSNAAWVASNVTKGSTSVATPTGATSTTVRLTSSAANGTLLQTVTAGASQYAYSVYMKRVTGTGNIDLTCDNGTTWTTKTLTSSWQRFDVYDASETNPVIGVRIVTSGDAIDFWGSQLEATGKPTSYTGVTTSSSVTRSTELITTTDLSWLSSTAGTAYVHASQKNPGNYGELFCLDNGSGTEKIELLFNNDSKMRSIIVDGGATQASIVNSAGITANTFHRFAAAWEANDHVNYQDGTAGTPDTSVTLPTPTTLRIGHRHSASQLYLTGHIKEIRYYDTRLTDDEVEAMSNGTFPSTNAKALVRNAAQNLSRNLVINIGS